MADVNRVNLRMTAQEKARLQARAKASGETMKDMVLRLANGDGEASTRVDGPYRQLPLQELRPSRTASQVARRERFGPEDLAGLAESIEAFGVIEPLVVRAAPTGLAEDGELLTEPFEVVAGERRWHAARMAGLAAVPVVVGEWTDEQAQLVQLVENLQREGLHEMDEARGYGELVDRHGWDVQRLCGEIGKSRSYVYSRLRLRSLHSACQQALEKGEINTTVARCLATVPLSLQEDALDLLRRQYGGVSTRQAESLIEKYFRRPLDGSGGFDPGDRSLQATWDAAFEGTCNECPWNTSVEKSLGGGAGRCVQPGCFDDKLRQVVAARVREAEQAGREVVRGDEADFEYGRPKTAKFVTGHWETESVREAAADAGIEMDPVVLVSPSGEAVHEVYRRKDVRKALGSKDDRKRPRETREHQRIGQASILLDRALPSLPGHLEPVTRALMRLFVEHVRQNAANAVRKRLAKEWGNEMLEAERDGAWIAALPDGELVRFGAQLCAALDFDSSSWAPGAADLLVAAAEAAREAHPEAVD